MAQTARGSSNGHSGPLINRLLHSGVCGQRATVSSSGDNADFAALSA